MRKKTKNFPGKGEHGAARVVRARAKGAFVLVCDHASSRIPAAFRKTFGVAQKDLRDHMGVDVGAARLTLELSRRLGSAAVLATASRLFMEMNRPPGHAESIQPHSHGVDIPGNEGLTRAQREERRRVLFDPYHAAVEAQIGRHLDAGVTPLQVYVHSFTPEALYGKKRPWHIGVLWEPSNKALSRALVRSLEKQNPRLTVGSNQPYSLIGDDDVDYSVNRHAIPFALPYLFLEIRNDQIRDAAGVKRWGGIIERALRSLPGF